MTDSNDTTVHSLLDDATEALDDIGIDLVDAEETDGPGIDLETDGDAASDETLPEPLESSDLPALAQSAHELLEERDVEQLLEEIGFEGVDEDAPASIPEAILAGDPSDVATLRGLQRLARLAEIQDEGEDTSTGSIEEAVAELRTVLARRLDEVGDESSQDEAEDRDGAEGESESDTTEDLDEEVDESEAADDESEKTGDDGIGSSITDALEESVSEFSDEIEAVQSGLEAVGADDDSGEGDDDGANDAESDDSTEGDGDVESDDDIEDDADPDDVPDESDTDEDDGLLGGSGQSQRRRGRMHSTVARSPSKRPDMKAVKRHSTVPDRQ
ncbi:hypothetical protein ACLI4Y_06575 [Natrialbaceae archaeon A-CW3]